MKKFVATILIVLMVVACISTFVGCDGVDDDNTPSGNTPNVDTSSSDNSFAGAISKKTYESVEDAVKGFLVEEISCQSYTVEYVKYTKVEDLTQNQIDKLAIDELLKSSIVSVEMGKVEYIRNENSNIELMANISEDIEDMFEEIYERTVYVIICNENGEMEYHYYTPAEEIGQSPSASAVESLFDMEKYLNCTTFFEPDNNFKNLFYLTENATYNAWIDDDSDNYTDEAYSILYNETLYSVERKIGNESLKEIKLINDGLVYECADISDYAKVLLSAIFYETTLFTLRYHSNCFEKTDNGYVLSKPITIGGEYMDAIYLKDIKVDVADGVIKNVTMTSKWLDLEDSDFQTTKISFYDFGTTKVDVPQDIIDAVKEYEDGKESICEPIIGIISQSTYESIEDAVKGFLNEEIKGLYFTAEYVDYTKIEDLTQEQIELLAIDDELKGSILSVEKCEIEYIEEDSYQEITNKRCTRTVYIVTCIENDEIKYRYYTPAEEIGQSPTASSLADLFDIEKYANCTITLDSETNTDKILGNSTIIKFTENCSYSLTKEEGAEHEIEGFVLSYNELIYQVLNIRYDGNNSERVDLVEDSTMLDYIEHVLQNLYFNILKDFSNRFKKTSTGYALNGQICEENKVISGFVVNISDDRIENYTLKYTHIASEEGELSYSMNITATFSDFGTTEVEVPQYVFDAIETYIANN